MLARDIRDVRFHQKLRGYDPKAVDDALENLARKIDEGERPYAGDCSSRAFPTRLRGYDSTEVDRFLERVWRETR